MIVHSPRVGAVVVDMDTSAAQASLFDAGDAEWIADLFDTMRAGDLDIVIDRLESVAVLMRKAAKARRMLATIEPDLLRAGLRIRDTRDGAS